jgi:hypothetical protein
MTSSIKLCSGAEASIPLQRELGIGILKKLIRQAGLNIDEFNKL